MRHVLGCYEIGRDSVVEFQRDEIGCFAVIRYYNVRGVFNRDTQTLTNAECIQLIGEFKKLVRNSRAFRHYDRLARIAMIEGEMRMQAWYDEHYHTLDTVKH